MRTAKSRRRVVVLAAIVAVAASPGSADDGEWERPFVGVLPEPEEHVSVNPPEDGVATPLPRAAAWIVDGATGRPVPGATLTLFPEDVGMGVTSYARTIAVGTADATGLAALDASAWTGAGHWIAEAPGYAPSHEYGGRPPTRIALARGTDLRGRVLDPMGRAVEGAVVDAYLGCEHSGTVRTARSAKDGMFALPSLAPDETQYWVTSPAGCLGFAQGLGRLGRRPSDVLLTSARTVTGRFVDAAGEPIAGVVVRAIDFDRSPVSTSDARGRFELAAFPEGFGLHGVAPGGSGDFVIDRHEVGPLPLTIHLDAGRQPVVPQDDAKIALRIVTDSGTPVDDERIRMTRLSDGHSFTVTTGDDEGEPRGTAFADVPSGTYDVGSATPFEPVSFPPFRWVIGQGDTAQKIVAAVAQPTLDLRGMVPASARLVLAVPGGDVTRTDDLAAWHPNLPADVPAVVSVRPFANERAVFFFGVGPAVNGARAVGIAVPPPHRVRPAGPSRIDVRRLTCDGFDVAYEDQGPTFSTYAEGPMVLDANVGDEVRRIAFEIPPKQSGEITLDFAGATPVTSRGVVHVLADAPGAHVRVESASGSVSGGTEAEADPPCRVIVTRAGYQPLDRTFTEPAEIRHRWGTCALRVAVHDDSGTPVPSIVLVDDVCHWTNAGTLELAGLAAGPHRVVVSPVRTDLAGRELQLVLRDGETRAREVAVSRR